MAIKIDNKGNKIEKVDGSQGIVSGDLNIEGELTVNGQAVVVKSSEPGSDTTTFNGNVKICKTSTKISGEHRIGYNVDSADYNFTSDNEEKKVTIGGYDCGTLRGTGGVGTGKYFISYVPNTGCSMQQQEDSDWKDTRYITLATEGMELATVRFIYPEKGDLTVEGDVTVGGKINGVNWHWKEIEVKDTVTNINTPWLWIKGDLNIEVNDSGTTLEVNINWFRGSEQHTVKSSDIEWVFQCSSTDEEFRIHTPQGRITDINGTLEVLTFK